MLLVYWNMCLLILSGFPSGAPMSSVGHIQGHWCFMLIFTFFWVTFNIQFLYLLASFHVIQNTSVRNFDRYLDNPDFLVLGEISSCLFHWVMSEYRLLDCLLYWPSHCLQCSLRQQQQLNMAVAVCAVVVQSLLPLNLGYTLRKQLTLVASVLYDA